jgi:hypothetical protein
MPFPGKMNIGNIMLPPSIDWMLTTFQLVMLLRYEGPIPFHFTTY